MGFQPESFVGAMTTGYNNGEFERYEIAEAMDRYSHFLTDEELTDTQQVVQRHFSILSTIHEGIVAERIRRNPPNQITQE